MARLTGGVRRVSRWTDSPSCTPGPDQAVPSLSYHGAAPPLSVLPRTMRTVANFDPLNYAVRALQDPWFGYGITGTNLIVLAGIAVAGGTGAALLFRRH